MSSGAAPARKIVPIVEGDGEVTAAPALLYRLLHRRGVYDVHVATPKNANGRDNLLKPNGLERFVALASLEPGCGAILLLLDSEGGCPVELARGLADRVRAKGTTRPMVIVAAHKMFENWFVAGVEGVRGRTLEGRAGIAADTPVPDDCEAMNGKSYLGTRLPPGRAYKETEDQEAMSKLFDLDLAEQRSRSFRRLLHAVEEALAAMQGGAVLVTPAAGPAPPAPTGRQKRRR